MSSASSSLTDAQLSATTAVADVVAVLSILGSLFIVLCYARFQQLRKFSFKLVAILSLTDIFNHAFDLVGPPTSDIDAMNAGTLAVTPQCLAQALGNSFCELSSVLWTTAIAATLYMFVHLRLGPDDVERRLPRFIAVCCGVPLLFALLPLADNAYGPAGSWCWITKSKVAWTFAMFYIPLWLAMAFNAVVYARTFRLLSVTLEASGSEPGAGAGGDETAAKLRKVLARLQIYPFILVIVWFFASLNRIYVAASGGQEVFALYFLQKVFSSSQGLLNAFAYGLSDGVRDAVAEQLAVWFPSLARAHPGLSVVASSGAASSGGAGGGGAAGAATVAAVFAGTSGSASGSASAAATLKGRALSREHLALDGELDDDDIHVRVPPSATQTALAPAAGAVVVSPNPAAAPLAAARQERVAQLQGMGPPR